MRQKLARGNSRNVQAHAGLLWAIAGKSQQGQESLVGQTELTLGFEQTEGDIFQSAHAFGGGLDEPGTFGHELEKDESQL